MTISLQISATRTRILELGRWSILLCLFFVPINKPLTNIFIFLALIFSLLGERTIERYKAACKEPVAVGTGIWFLILVLFTVYSPAGAERWIALGKFKALLYPLIAVTLLETPQWRKRTLLAFGLSASLILMISWGQFLGIFRLRDIAQGNSAYMYTVFKDYSQQALLFLILAALGASLAHSAVDINRKRFLWLLSAAAFFNVLFLLQSRTAYLIAIPLLLYWLWQIIGNRRSLILGSVILGLVIIAASFTSRVQDRMQQARQDLSHYSVNHEATSLGIRIELWKRTIPIIQAAPFLGHGIGQWQIEYENQTKGLPNFEGFRMEHPHQESLLILSEQGIVGFFIFVTMLILLLSYIRRLAAPERHFYTSVLLIYVTAGLANCILVDFSHRHLFLMLLACIPFVPSPSKKGFSLTR